MTGLVFRIARFAVHDGPGIRTTVFFKGCPLRCWWCHSPESQTRRQELAVRADRCIDCGACEPACPQVAITRADNAWVTDREACEACGTCVRVCPSGAREIAGITFTPDQLAAEVEKDAMFFEESGGGVTFSGGEPLMQPAFLEAVLRLMKAGGIHTAVDTCGLADRDALRRITPLTDLFLFDLKQMDAVRHREVTGVSNQRILESFAEIAAAGRPMRVRFPLVPGVNDEPDHVDELARFVRQHGVDRVDVLPYHRAGLSKYERFGIESPLSETMPPSPELVDEVVRALRRHGLTVQVGG
jgi:pyruvate formate lyase activating enzyme